MCFSCTVLVFGLLWAIGPSDFTALALGESKYLPSDWLERLMWCNL